MMLVSHCSHAAFQADAVAAHPDGFKLVIGVSIVQTHRFCVFGSQLEEVSDFNAMIKGNLSTAVRADIAFLHHGIVTHSSGSEIFQVAVEVVMVALIGAHNKVLFMSNQPVHINGNFQTNWAGETDSRTGCLHDIFRFSQSQFQSAQRLGSLGFVEFSVTRQHESHQITVSLIDQCLYKIRRLFVQERRYFFDGSGIGCVNQFKIQFFSIIILQSVHNFRDFQVGRIITGVTAQNGVFTDGGNGLVFFRKQAAHGAGIRLHDADFQTKTIHDLIVGVSHLLIGHFQSFRIGVKGVGVLHNEFAHPDQAVAGSGFIPVFGLNLVKVIREILVGFAVHHGGQSKHFFVGGT